MKTSQYQFTPLCFSLVRKQVLIVQYFALGYLGIALELMTVTCHYRIPRMNFKRHQITWTETANGIEITF